MSTIAMLLIFGYEFASDVLRELLGERMCDAISLLVR